MMSGEMMHELPLVGYSDRLSARPGESIAFKVSSRSERPFHARLTRVICADPNPDGPGIIEQDADRWFAPRDMPSRRQPFHPGSWARAEGAVHCPATGLLELTALIWPTLRRDGGQAVLALGNLSLRIGPAGDALADDGETRAATGVPLSLRRWHRVTARFDAAGGVSIEQVPLYPIWDAPADARAAGRPRSDMTARPAVAARPQGDAAREHFNGKIEAPEIRHDGERLAGWDFSQDMGSATVPGLAGPALRLVNFPARAMTGSRWDGTEMCWRHAPGQYAAIHFHDDDIFDFGWQTDFTLTVPADMPSGAYAMRIECDGHADAMPVFVLPPRGAPRARLCVLIPTFTYVVYGNHARPDFAPEWMARFAEHGAWPINPAQHPEYGLSTYNTHADGAGICHASHRRPLFNLRPGYVTFGNTTCSGLRHFPADTHLLAWLHARGIDCDLLTDHELDTEGTAALAGYSAVATTTHPEYHTARTLDALAGYRDAGGALLYLGGNGFYWRIARHAENDSLIEIRRAEGGIRAWAAEPGEYYHAFDGAYGGLWRRNGRPPQDLVGIGFAAQGQFLGRPYRRIATDPSLDWVFEGLRGAVFGDSGLSGHGAAGFELDHADPKLGAPGRVTVLARSFDEGDEFILVPEERLTHITNLTGGPEDEAKHAEMVLVDCPGGGVVFATGSITFCGSLPAQGYDSDVARLLGNVLHRFMARPAPHETGASRPRARSPRSQGPR